MIGTYREPSYQPPSSPRLNLKDRFGLEAMVVGERKMFYLTANLLSPYLSYYKKIGKGLWRTINTVVEGRRATIIERLK